MKDNKVSDLCKTFEKQVADLNKTWAELQRNNVYIRIDVKGNNNYTDPKYFQITSMTQSIEYFKAKETS